MANYAVPNHDVMLAPGIEFYWNEGEHEVRDLSTNQVMDYNDDMVKVKIFERQINKRFLNVIKRLLNKPHHGHIATLSLLSLIEYLQQLWTGQSSRNQSSRFIKNWLTRTLDIDENTANIVYTNARCGFVHNGGAGKFIVITKSRSKAPTPIHLNNNAVFINYKLLHKAVCENLDDLISKVKNDPAQRSRFINIYDPFSALNIQAE